MEDLGFIGLVVITVVGVVKDFYPITGNQTRLVALIVGGLLGVLGQFNLLPGITVNVVTGVMSGIAAVGVVTVTDRIGSSLTKTKDVPIILN